MKTTVGIKRVLVYGDSITWGRIPNKAGRYDEHTRWTAIMQEQLGDDIEVIEEGLRGRFLAGENPYLPNRNGLLQFGPIFASQLPVDLLVIFLGTNDTNSKANKRPAEIANGLPAYFQAIDTWCMDLQMTKPQVLIVAPPLINESVLKPDSMFKGAGPKSVELALHYEAVAKRYNAFFFDSSKIVRGGSEDGVHLDIETNRILGLAIAPVVVEILK